MINITFGLSLQQDSNSSWDNIGIAIGFASCTPNTVYSGCYPSEESLGRTLLYHGTFNPVFGKSLSGAPFQNFTVTIPGDVPHGKAQINVANFLTVGVGPSFLSLMFLIYDRKVMDPLWKLWALR